MQNNLHGSAPGKDNQEILSFSRENEQNEFYIIGYFFDSSSGYDGVASKIRLLDEVKS